MIKLQDFARDCGVTDRAIQKHLKKHEKALEGHFHRRGPNGTWLDETAQDYIRSLMKEAPVVVADSVLQREKEELQAKYSAALEQIIVLERQNNQLQLENARIALLEAENGKKDEILAEAEKTSQKLSDELSSARAQKELLQKENEQMKSAGFWQRLRGWK